MLACFLNASLLACCVVDRLLFNDALHLSPYCSARRVSQSLNLKAAGLPKDLIPLAMPHREGLFFHHRAFHAVTGTGFSGQSPTLDWPFFSHRALNAVTVNDRTNCESIS